MRDTLSDNSDVSREESVKKPLLSINMPFHINGFIASMADYYSITTLSGTAINVESGRYVQAELNGQTWQGRVDSNGEWSIPLPPSAITSLISDDLTISHTLTVSVANSQGDVARQTRNVSVPNYYHDRPMGIGINPIAGNDEIIGREKMHGQVISGLTHGVPEDAVVTVFLDEKAREALVDGNGFWSITLTPDEMKALTPGEHSITVEMPHANGETPVSTGRNFNVTKEKGTAYAAEITINRVSGDDVLMPDEQKSGLIVSGTTANVASGKEVWVQLGENIYAATVKNNHWQAKIPAEDLALLHNGSATLVASVKDLHETATAVHQFSIGETLTVPHLIFHGAYDNFSAEGLQWLLASETLSGVVTRVPEGTLVRVQLGTLSWETPVGKNGHWHLLISPAELMSQPPEALPLTVSVSNAQGETATLTRTISYHGFDTEDQTLLVMNPISGDDFISSREQNADIVISGATLNVPEGQAVEVTLQYPYGSLVLQSKIDSNGEWAVLLSAEQREKLYSSELDVQAVIKNDSQWQNPNGGELSTRHTLLINRDMDYDKPLALYTDNFHDGQHFSLDQFPDGLTLKGHIDRYSADQQVSVQIGQWSWTTETLYGNWEITLSSAHLAALRAGSATIEVSLLNNETDDTSSKAVHVVFERPEVVPETPEFTIDPIMGTDHLTHTEKPIYHPLTGTVNGEQVPFEKDSQLIIDSDYHSSSALMSETSTGDSFLVSDGVEHDPTHHDETEQPSVATLADLGLSGGEDAIAALLALTAEKAENAPVDKMASEVALPAPTGDIWTADVGRSISDDAHYTVQQQPDISDLLNHNVVLA